jgi:hypothetical protein
MLQAEKTANRELSAESVEPLPRAVRQDHDPFIGAWRFQSFAKLLFLLRWTSYQCPSCGSVFRRDFWLRNFRLGPGLRICTHCRSQFDDGSREWPELPLASRLRLFLPPLVVGIWGGFVFAAVASLYIGPRDEHSWGVVFLVSAVGLIPVLAWSPVALMRVIYSIHRYNARGGAGV